MGSGKIVQLAAQTLAGEKGSEQKDGTAEEAPPARPKINSYRDLIVWNDAMDLVIETYALSKLLPKTEEYRIVAQMTRAAVSVPANIAEGFARYSRRDYAHFITIAKGSHAELETYFELVVRLGFVSKDQAFRCVSLATEVGKMLTSLRSRLMENA